MSFASRPVFVINKVSPLETVTEEGLKNADGETSDRHVLEVERDLPAERAKSELDVLQSLTTTVSPKPKPRRSSVSETIGAAFTRENLFHAAEKDFVKKIYRSEKALKEEQQRQQHIKSFVIHPFSNFRWYWDLWMILLMAITLVILPINIAFFSEQISLQWSITNCITDSFFMADIVLNFFTGIIHHQNEEVILDRKAIASNYLRGWFLVDLPSSFPMDYFYLLFRGDSDFDETALKYRAIKLAKILSVFRLLRLTRLLRYIHRLEEILNVEGEVIRITNLVLVVLVMIHWNGCVQFLVPFFQGFPRDSWVVISGLENASKWEQYSWSFFKAICHMLSIGFGQHPPQNLTEMWCATLSMMLGATFYALFIGHMSTLLLSIDASGRIYNEKISQVKEYMRYRKIPASTQKRVLRYYEHRYQRKYFDEDTILREQSAPLRKEIVQHHLRSLVKKAEFLSKGSPGFVIDIIEKLHFEVYLAGDVIIKAGTRGNAMYFIEHGTVKICINERVVGTLQDGDHFGEISLLIDERRVASVVAASTCDLYRLAKEDFQDVLDENPEMHAIMAKVAKERLSKIGTTSKKDEEMETVLDRNSSHKVTFASPRK
ncbi:potassium/sodium hyperpolarization-activated cyclic nucleotide-gated channel 2-like isoform X1 [Acanthaster planci]|uniref:Potassium/sodium hyperpolarization-activated cyclic nucleotide-gated channel 2-like isoform X1 n=1 Tax=Acanthaster planci TaxID=133434 RepID=A0A8B7XH90_ACAPL|nr:potassium/sodium hyperpolarization-activated cyclic nucleotide-gated channel 2-like isoform X1 [Acanthaster planci]